METVLKGMRKKVIIGDGRPTVILGERINPTGKKKLAATLVAEYKTAVIGLCMDDDGIPETPEKRLAVAKKIVERAAGHGIEKKDILIDCLALTVGTASNVVSVSGCRMMTG